MQSSTRPRVPSTDEDRTLDRGDLEHYLHHHIPISQAMGITVATAAPDTIELRAALRPNLNHRDTAFGGSVASLAVLAGWSLLRVGLDNYRPTPQIVIQRSSIEYTAPVLHDFDARCHRPSPERWQRFIDALERRRRGRIEVDVEIRCNGAAVGALKGAFVAMRTSPASVQTTL